MKSSFYITNFYGTLFKYSVSTDLNNMLAEWEITKIKKDYENENYCICTHPITELVYIQNKLNGNELIIGNCCMDKIGKVPERMTNNLFRLKKDITKSMNRDLIDFIQQKYNLLTKWEFNFYLDIMKKRKLSDRQMEIKQKINQKVIKSFTTK